jgi:hypothetical protein
MEVNECLRMLLLKNIEGIITLYFQTQQTVRNFSLLSIYNFLNYGSILHANSTFYFKFLLTYTF